MLLHTVQPGLCGYRQTMVTGGGSDEIPEMCLNIPLRGTLRNNIGRGLADTAPSWSTSVQLWMGLLPALAPAPRLV